MDSKLNKQIAAQQQKVADAKKQLATLQAKARETETKRFQRLAAKVGLFDVEVSDENFENALAQLVKAAGSPQKETAVSA